ncbi:MAG: hypothetical protein CHACPFDD_03866 [Phycisphaerae bacterium]|nr:hypothetical protein [Phycisphaerae bacterium]
MSQDLLRLIDSICRDKNIERDSFISDLENAVVTALRKSYSEETPIEVTLDRMSGRFQAVVNGEPVDLQHSRIAAQTAKQFIMQRTRERERSSIYEEFLERQGTIVTGSVSKVEGGALIVNLGRAEGFLPRSEQIPGETHQVGDRIRAMVLEVRELPHQIKIVLSRSHPEFISRLFELEVPEIAERIIEIRALAREAGYRTKVAVSSIDSKVDAVGACVGVRGSRIKNIVEELNNEKIDIVRWNESSQILIGNALKPAEVQETALCFELGKASVVVAEDQLSLAIGKRGQNVRLASRLTGWDIDIVTPIEYNANMENVEQTVRSVAGVDDMLIDKLVAMGCVSVEHIESIGPEPLVSTLEISPELAEEIVYVAGEEAIKREEAREEAAKQKAALAAAQAAAGVSATASAVSGAVAPSEPLPADVQSDAATSAFTADDAALPVTGIDDSAAPSSDAPAEEDASSHPNAARPDQFDAAEPRA